MTAVNIRDISIEKIKESLNATVYVDGDSPKAVVHGVYASDLMSDVLAYGKSGFALLTGLNSIQAAISSYMAEFRGIVFLRGKIPETEILDFAKEKGLFIFSTEDDMYEACVAIASIEGGVSLTPSQIKHTSTAENVTIHKLHIDGQDYASAGMVSTQVKSILKSIGYDPQLIRRVAIATYEAEMNVVMHAVRARVILSASDTEIKVSIEDEGKGIENIELAMQEGYSTATEEQRALGFGAGMGLPNIKKNSDELNIDSEVGKGTSLQIIFKVK